ncbi:MAG: tetratricopeptide repeat protein [Desulfosarcina sp.]|nr:tetratricopeptide repeat protein [Desulfosarcina sp.]
MYDDEPNILANENVHLTQIDVTSLKKSFYLKSQDLSSGERVKRPLAYLSFALNWYVGKNHVFGYHLVNFLIHFTATVFLYLFIKNSLMLPLFGNKYHSTAHTTAFLSAMIWAIHPIHVTAVTYIVQRMASMAGMFTIMSLYGYLKARTADTRPRAICFFAASGGCALCAFATKENSAMLPVCLFFYEIIMIRGVAGTDVKKMWRWGLPALGMVILVGLIYIDPSRLLDGYENRPYTPVERVMTQARVVLIYLKMLFYPLQSELTLVHDIDVSTSLWSPWTTLPCIILVGVLFFSALFWLSRRQPMIAFAVVFFFVNHAIEGSFIGLELIYEHRNYIPSMILFVIPVILLLQTLDYFSYSRKYQMLYVVSVAVILASIGHSTYAYSNLFRHGLIFWRDNAKKSPHLSVVQNNYGIELMKHGFNDRAFQALQRSKTSDRYFNRSQKGVTYHNLGLYYQTIANDYPQALSYFKKATAITLNSKTMWLAYARCELVNGNVEKAKAHLEACIQKWPEDHEVLTALAKIQLLRGNTDAALAYALQARGARTGAAAPLAIFGEVYRLRGNLTKAVFFWQAYRSHRPDSLVAALALSELYYQTGSYDRLSRVVADLMAAKGDRSWDVWLEAGVTRAKLDEAVAYSQDPEYLLSVISFSLRKESKKAGKSR